MKITYEMMTPGYLLPIWSSRISPKCINLFPEHRFGSQWPRSQQAALKGGRFVVIVSSSWLSSLSLRGAENFLLLAENLSFLCRTISLFRAEMMEEKKLKNGVGSPESLVPEADMIR
jgi:hypothetical protein